MTIKETTSASLLHLSTDDGEFVDYVTHCPDFNGFGSRTTITLNLPNRKAWVVFYIDSEDGREIVYAESSLQWETALAMTGHEFSTEMVELYPLAY